MPTYRKVTDEKSANHLRSFEILGLPLLLIETPGVSALWDKIIVQSYRRKSGSQNMVSLTSSVWLQIEVDCCSFRPISKHHENGPWYRLSYGYMCNSCMHHFWIACNSCSVLARIVHVTIASGTELPSWLVPCGRWKYCGRSCKWAAKCMVCLPRLSKRWAG